MTKPFLLLALFLFSSSAWAEVDGADLLHLSQSQLDELYRQSQAGPVLNGRGEGEAIFFPGSAWENPMFDWAQLVWQGKIFDSADNLVYNRVFGFRGIKGTLGTGKSLVDGQPAITISYANTLVFRQVFDELRQVGDKLYLGRAYVRCPTAQFCLWTNFALQF